MWCSTCLTLLLLLFTFFLKIGHASLPTLPEAIQLLQLESINDMKETIRDRESVIADQEAKIAKLEAEKIEMEIQKTTELEKMGTKVQQLLSNSKLP